MSAAWLAAAAVALGHALQIADGFYAPDALAWVTAALVCTGIGLALTRRDRPASGGTRAVAVVLAAGIAWQIVSLVERPPGMYLRPDASMGLFRAGVMAEAIAIAIGVANLRPLRRVWFPALLVVQALLGVWMLHASPDPRIDVVTVHRAAIRALRRGRDPYRITFQNIYGPGSPFYNPTLVQDGRVEFGYPYPPLSLIAAVPAQACCGDYRYAEVAATVVAAAAVGYAVPGVTPQLAAALLVTTPRGPFVIEQGWTEPLAVMLLALFLVCVMHRSRAAPWVAGLLLAVKQYLALGVPLVIRLAKGVGIFFVNRRAKNIPTPFVTRVVIAGAIVTLPFALWHPRAFLDAVVLLQMREPFRNDSLSYLSWAARHGWGIGSIAWSLGAGAIAVVAGMLWTPNTPVGFTATLAFSTLATFAFGSKAFCNYYYFVVGALCCATAAALDARTDAAEDGSPCAAARRSAPSSSASSPS